jgi:hypothetical protein
VSGGRHGRRDNGLFAADYAVVADVDPRVGEHLLDVLGNRGIAAYLQPTADQHPVTRVTTLPGRPTDRLYVDRSELDTARQFLAVLIRDSAPAEPAVDGESTPPAATAPALSVDEAPAPAARTSTEFDAAWASIVANFDNQAAYSGALEGSTPWPAIEDLTTHDQAHDPEVAEDAAREEPATPREWPRWQPRDVGADDPSLLDSFDSFGSTLPDDEDEDYQPPAPPPLPRLAAVTIIGIIAILCGIALVADPDLLASVIDTTATAVLGCGLMLGGAVALIGRLRSGTDDDEPDDPDDGAIV